MADAELADATAGLSVGEDAAEGADAAATAKKAEANRKKREKAKAKKQAAKMEAGKVLSIAQVNADEYLLATAVGSELGRRVQTWFAAYEQAYEAEHTWLESRKQKTSRSMGYGPLQVLPLMFHDEGEFKRLSFYAHYDIKPDDAVGWATVDVDPDASKVCHIRMMLVPPELQRQGVGLAMLKFIVMNLPTRHLGLKYSKCNDYHKFFSTVGFKRIGDDEHFIYMALRRPKAK